MVRGRRAMPYPRRSRPAPTRMGRPTAEQAAPEPTRVQRIGPRPDHQQRRRQHHQRPRRLLREHARDRHHRRQGSTPQREHGRRQQAQQPPAGVHAGRAQRRSQAQPQPQQANARPRSGTSRTGAAWMRSGSHAGVIADGDARCLPRSGHPGCPTPARMRAMRGRPFPFLRLPALLTCLLLLTALPALAVQRPPVSGGLPDYEHTAWRVGQGARRHLGHHPGPGRPVVAGHRLGPVPLRWPPFRTAAGPGRQPLPSTNMVTLAHGHDGALWIGYFQAGISRFAQGQLHSYGRQQGVPVGVVPHFSQDREGQLWRRSMAGCAGSMDNAGSPCRPAPAARAPCAVGAARQPGNVL